MMQNIVSGTIAGILAGIALMFTGFLISIILPKSKVIAMLKEKNIFRAMRYLTTSLLLALAYLALPLNKLFVFVVCLLFAFIVIMFVYDYYQNSLNRFMGDLNRIETQKKHDELLDQLSQCNYDDTERIAKIKAKLKGLR